MNNNMFGAEGDGMLAGMPEEYKNEVSPEVRELLEQSTAGELPLPNQTIPLVMDGDTVEELESKDRANNAVERIDVATTPQWDPAVVNEQKEADPWDAWRRNAQGLGVVEVSENDKVLFLKAAMHDQEVVLPVSLPGNMIVRVKSLGVKAQRAMSLAMHKDTQKGILVDDSLWFARLQYFSLVLQIVGVGDGDRGLIPADVDLDAKSVNEIADWLCENADDVLAELSGPRYALLTQAVMIFEAKLARCKEGLINGDFFAIADMSF